MIDGLTKPAPFTHHESLALALHVVVVVIVARDLALLEAVVLQTLEGGQLLGVARPQAHVGETQQVVGGVAVVDEGIPSLVIDQVLVGEVGELGPVEPGVAGIFRGEVDVIAHQSGLAMVQVYLGPLPDQVVGCNRIGNPDPRAVY